MKKVLGLDLGTTSIGWAFVHEAENENEKSAIIRTGVRVNPLSTDEQSDFEKGKSISINADRTLKRGARRNLQRYKHRRDGLKHVLQKNGLINGRTVLAENGKGSTHSLLALRNKAATERIEKEELARVLLAINKKRGYKSNRKAKGEDEDGTAVDGMAIAKILIEKQWTPGQYCFQQLKEGKKHLPEFYRSDLQAEFEKVWACQKQFYPEQFTEELRSKLEGQGQKKTVIELKNKGIFTADLKGKREEKLFQAYEWRSLAVNNQLEIEQAAFVLAEINKNLASSSGYLGEISDRSKELFFNDETVGQYLYQQIERNPHKRLKKQVFYRQDYEDEFEKIWTVQAQFHPELTPKLKKEIKENLIFNQRNLKSQKGLISFCEFESEEIEVMIDGKPKMKRRGSRVAPKASHLFQEFKIWQNLSHVIIKNKNTKELLFNEQAKQTLFEELNLRGKLTKKESLKLVNANPNEWDMNFSELEGNRTNADLFEKFVDILKIEGYENTVALFKKKKGAEIKEQLRDIFQELGIDPLVLNFDAELEGMEYEAQPSYKLWHLLYSYAGDKSKTGNESLYKKLEKQFGFKREHAKILAGIAFQEDYGSLSSKAIRKILPHLKTMTYDKACEQAGYNHSHSLTKEENEQRTLKDHLDLLPKNSLRNPVVEKILNQLVNVVNAIIKDPELGKPDEIRIELARELKQSADKRAKVSKAITDAQKRHEKIRGILKHEFRIPNPTRNDIIKYKLYEELSTNGHKTLYSNTYVPRTLYSGVEIHRDDLFSNKFDIEHIIPKARLFDDSFSNKTIELSDINREKSDRTAYDFVAKKYGEDGLAEYEARVRALKISDKKRENLLKKKEDIKDGFIARDLKETQYIAKKAKAMLLGICRNVVPTTGQITDKLREEWGVIGMLKELSLEKYKKQLPDIIVQKKKKDGTYKEDIEGWTKRNDHRHHAMDALVVAFTQHNHVQYFSYLNAREDNTHKEHKNILEIERKITFNDAKRRKKFKSPMPYFRQEARKHLENTLISFKNKNKVVTQNRNKTKGSDKVQVALTPRGQMHKETVYGKKTMHSLKEMKIEPKFDLAVVQSVAKKIYRDALLQRLEQNGNDPKKAFGGKNALAKSPIYLPDGKPMPEKVQVIQKEAKYTIRKDIGPDLDSKKIQKVLDKRVREILQKRLDEYGGKAKEAFANLEENPIWHNKEKGVCIKSVTMSGINNAYSLHDKRDHKGELILDEGGKSIPTDFVSGGNNHHVAIYRDEKGNLQEEVVSFFEAVARVNAKIPVINKQHKDGWEFLFSMKQNEMFVFPSDDFDPSEIDLLDPSNHARISPHLFRVQKFTNKDYYFRHHLETSVENIAALKNVSWLWANPNRLKGIVKVRINHLGKIVYQGEY